jgi:hypothetical protein
VIETRAISDFVEAPALRVRASFWKPSLADCLFAALMIWLVLFSLSGTGIGLLEDSGTGYHIRTGDYILDHHSVPHSDIFSFTNPGEPWFAWEWLASVMYSALFRWSSMKGVVLISAAIIALSIVIVMFHMIHRGSNALVALFLIHLAVGASSIHFLARPHLFTILFAAVTMRLLDEDRLWWLVPLTALWANLHGGFVAGLMCIAAFGIGRAIEKSSFQPLLRYGGIGLACLAASVLNPYGIREHLHILEFLREKWIVDLVEEYQSPRFHSTGALYFEILLVMALLVSGWLLSRKRFAHALVMLLWAHYALVSVRHIPIFVVVALPPLAEALTELWNKFTARSHARSALGVLAKLADDHRPGLARISVWSAVVMAVLLFAPLGIAWPTDFPDTSYPTAFVTRHADLISQSRIFATDRWSDYLTFRFYPRQRIFIDGRGDFFGERLSKDYFSALNGGKDWKQTLDRYDVGVVMVPTPSGLASILRERNDWRLIDDDGTAALFERRQ